MLSKEQFVKAHAEVEFKEILGIQGSSYLWYLVQDIYKILPKLKTPLNQKAQHQVLIIFCIHRVLGFQQATCLRHLKIHRTDGKVK